MTRWGFTKSRWYSLQNSCSWPGALPTSPSSRCQGAVEGPMPFEQGCGPFCGTVGPPGVCGCPVRAPQLCNKLWGVCMRSVT